MGTGRSTTRSAADGPSRPRRRRWGRRAARALVVVLLVAAAGLGVAALNRHALLRSALAPRIEQALGIEFVAGRFSASPQGVVWIERPVWRVPGVEGEAGRLLSAERLTARVRLGALLSGDGVEAIRDIEALRPVIRLSQHIGTGALNIDPLVHRAAGAGDGAGEPFADAERSPPALRIIDGALEVGEHDDAGYTALARVRVEGELRPPTPGARGYAITLSELGAGEGRPQPPMALTGEIDLAASSASLRLRNVDLGAIEPQAVPTRVRDIISRMNIEGTATESELHYGPEHGLEAELRLAGVHLTTPVPAGMGMQDGQSTPRTLRMRAVNGAINLSREGLRADLHGQVQGLPLEVELVTQGFSPTSPFTTTVRIEQNYFEEIERVAVFAPPEAQSIIAQFLGPRALVDGEVHVVRERGEPGGDSSVRFDGAFNFQNGSMAYAAFPYPIENISGEVVFDEQGLHMRNFRGAGPTGAALSARAEFFGYEETDGFEIWITAEDAPLDDALARVMPPDWREILDGLIDRDAYERMRERGLLQTLADKERLEARLAERTSALRENESLRTSQRMDLEREIAELRERLAVPVFEPGGVGRARIGVIHPRGTVDEFNYDIAVHIPRASLLPAQFNYPLVAEPLRVQVRDGLLIESESLRGLTGGTGEGRISAPLGGDEINALVEASLRDLPINPLLREVLPKIPTPLRPGLVTTPARLLEGLGLAGTIDASLRLAPEDPQNQLDALIAFENLTATPDPDGPTVLRKISGEASISGEEVRIGPVTGEVSGPVAAGLGMGSPAPLELLITADIADPEAGARVDVALEVDRLSLETPVERLVDVFSRDAGDALRDMRAERDPSGEVHLRVTLRSSPGEDLAAEATIRRGRWLSFNALGGRLTAQRMDGEIRLDLSDGTAHLREVGSSLLFDARPAGRSVLNGRMSLAPEGAAELSFAFESGRLESPLVRALAERMGGEALADALRARRVRGGFSGVAELRRAQGEAFAVTGWLEPDTLSLAAGESYLSFEEASGRVTFGPEGGALESVRLSAERWRLRADGRWFAGRRPGVETDFDLEGMGWPAALVGALPEAGRDAMEAIDFRVEGPWSIRDGRVRLRAAGGEDGAAASMAGGASGRLAMTDASFRAGVLVDEAFGEAAGEVAWGADAASPQIDMDLSFESMRALGLQLRDAEGRLRSSDADGAVALERFTADLLGGRVAGTAAVRAPEESGTPRRYDADLRVAGVDLGAMVGALSNPRSDALVRTDSDRGVVSGQVFMTGRVGDPSTRIGRGVLLAEEGELLGLPLLLGVIEFTNLQPPVGETIDYGAVEFSLTDDVVSIERMEAESPTLLVEGRGRLTLPEGGVDMTFTTRGRRRVPLLSTLLDTVRNELVAVRVTGTLREPRFRPQPLPAAGRVLEGVFSTGRRETGMVEDSVQIESQRDRSTPSVPLNR